MSNPTSDEGLFNLTSLSSDRLRVTARATVGLEPKCPGESPTVSLLTLSMTLPRPTTLGELKRATPRIAGILHPCCLGLRPTMLSAFSDSLLQPESLDGIHAVPPSSSKSDSELMFLTLKLIHYDISMSNTPTDSVGDSRQ